MSATVVVTHAFDTPPGRVFDAWLDTAMLAPIGRGCVLLLAAEIPDGREQYAARTRTDWTGILAAQGRVLSGGEGASA